MYEALENKSVNSKAFGCWGDLAVGWLCACWCRAEARLMQGQCRAVARGDAVLTGATLQQQACLGVGQH